MLSRNTTSMVDDPQAPTNKRKSCHDQLAHGKHRDLPCAHDKKPECGLKLEPTSIGYGVFMEDDIMPPEAMLEYLKRSPTVVSLVVKYNVYVP